MPKTSTSKTASVVVVGIDPGTANTGLVVVAGGRIRAAMTVRTKLGQTAESVGSFAELVARSRCVRDDVAAAVADTPAGRVEVAGVEAYKDYGGGHLRGAARRYYTPCTIAFIDQALEAAGIRVIYQDPSDVKREYKSLLAHWKSGRRGMISGDQCLHNEHLRDAAAHALYCADSLGVRHG